MSKSLGILSSGQYWGVIILLIFIPLLMKFPLLRVGGTFVAIRLEDFIILGVLLIGIIRLYLAKKLPQLFKNKSFRLAVIFMTVTFISLLSGVFLTKTISFKLGLFHWLRRAELLSLIFIGQWSLTSEKRLRQFMLIFTVVVALAGLYALGQRYFNFPAVSTINSVLSQGVVYYLNPEDRISATFSGHYDLAIFMMFYLVLAASIILYFLPKKFKSSELINFWPVFLLGLLAVLSLIILIMTAARITFLATGIGILAVLLILKKKRLVLLVAILGVLIILYPSQLRNRFIAIFTVNLKGQFEQYQAVSEEQTKRSLLNIPTLPSSGKRIESVGVNSADIAPGEPTNIVDLAVYRSFEIRTKVEWPRAIRAFYKNPLLGTGYSSLSLATDNDWLRSLGEVGLLGTTGFVFFMWAVIKKIKDIFAESKQFERYFTAGMMALIVAFIVNSLFIDVFEASKVATMFWLLIGFTLGINNYSRRGTK